jgi:hypothetical protein
VTSVDRIHIGMYEFMLLPGVLPKMVELMGNDRKVLLGDVITSWMVTYFFRIRTCSDYAFVASGNSHGAESLSMF